MNETPFIKFRAHDGERWWYEGEDNGFQYYRCQMTKSGDDWSFRRTSTVASSRQGHSLEYSTDGGRTWNRA